jgi:hypothetical protein
MIGPGNFVPDEMLVFDQNRPNRGRLWMKKKRFPVEQMIGVLKQAEVGVAFSANRR